MLLMMGCVRAVIEYCSVVYCIDNDERRNNQRMMD